MHLLAIIQSSQGEKRAPVSSQSEFQSFSVIQRVPSRADRQLLVGRSRQKSIEERKLLLLLYIYIYIVNVMR